jgi:hypothetical protein
VPREHVLFARDDGRFVLRLLPEMDGRLGTRDRVATLAELRPATEIALERGTRGRVRIGDATILFQEIAKPPAMPKPQLPASIRGTFADRIDTRLAAIVGASLVVHIALASYAWAFDREVEPPRYAHIAQPYHYDTIEITVPTPTPIDMGQAPGVGSPAAPTRPTVQRPRIDARDPTRLPVDGARIAQILTGDGTSEDGHPNGMRDRQPGAPLDQQIADARRHGVTIGDSDHTSRDVRDHVDTDRDPHVPIEQPSAIDHVVPKHDGDPQGRIKIGTAKTDDVTTLTPDIVETTIRTTYMAGLERCYHKGQVGDPTLSGKVALTFTVESHGRVTDPEAGGVTPQIDSCIQGLMGHWHFPAPRTKQGEPTDATYRISLALRP